MDRYNLSWNSMRAYLFVFLLVWCHLVESPIPQGGKAGNIFANHILKNSSTSSTKTNSSVAPVNNTTNSGTQNSSNNSTGKNPFQNHYNNQNNSQNNSQASPKNTSQQNVQSKSYNNDFLVSFFSLINGKSGNSPLKQLQSNDSVANQNDSKNNITNDSAANATNTNNITNDSASNATNTTNQTLDNPVNISQGILQIQRAEECTKIDCSRDQKYPTVTPSKEIYDYLKQKYANSVPKVTNSDIILKLDQFYTYLNKKQTKEEIQKKKFKSKPKKTSNFNPKQATFIKNIMQKKKSFNSGSGSSNNSRLLQSQSNQYQKVNEGNIQVHTAKCLFRRKTEVNGTHTVVGLSYDKKKITKIWSVNFENFMYVNGLHAKGDFLIILSEIVKNEKKYVNLLKIKISQCDIETYSYILKAGQYVGSRQFEGNLIVVSQSHVDLAQSTWYSYRKADDQINQFKAQFGRVLPQTNGVYSRYIWTFELIESGLFHLQEYYNTGFAYIINYQKEKNLYITSVAIDENVGHNVQIIKNPDPSSQVSWQSLTTSFQKGLVYNSFAQDQFDGRFRLFSVQVTSPPTANFFSYKVPQLTDKKQDSTFSNNPYELPASILFVKKYAYLVYSNMIVCYNTEDPASSNPVFEENLIQALFKFKGDEYLIGMGYKSTQQKYPLAKLYRISEYNLLQVGNTFIISDSTSSLETAKFTQNFFWSYQSILVNQKTNGVIFGMENINPKFVQTALTVKKGMYYMYVHTSGCLSKSPYYPGCKNSPPKLSKPQNNIVRLYGHYPKGVVPQSTQRYTIISQAGLTYLFSSSNLQFHARELTPIQNPIPSPEFIMARPSQSLVSL